MKNDYLVERKESIFTKIFKFLRNLFKRNNQEDNIDNNEEIIEKNQEIDNNLKSENSSDEYDSEFLAYLRIDKREEPELLELQRKFENKEILMSDMSDIDLIRLNDLYNRQITKMKNDLENKKTKVGMLKFKLSKQILS